MKIECKLQRKGGTHVEMSGGVTYHFAPQEDGRHVAEVTNERHIERFLAIPEGYGLLHSSLAEMCEEIVGKSEATAPVAAPIRAAEGVLVGSDAFPATFDIRGRVYQLGEIVARAFSDSGVTEIEWNELPAETRDLKIEMVLDGIEDGDISLPVPVVHTPAPEAPAAGNAAHTPAPVEDKPKRTRATKKSFDAPADKPAAE